MVSDMHLIKYGRNTRFLSDVPDGGRYIREMMAAFPAGILTRMNLLA